MRIARAIRPGRFAVSTLLAAMALAGCSDPDATKVDRADAPGTSASATNALGAEARLPAPVQELVMDGSEYAFKISPDPASGVRPGWTLLRFTNVGVEPHQVMFARLKDGVDLGKLAAAGAGDSSGAAAIEFVDMIGGVSYIGAGQETTAMVNLTEGLVLAMCYVPNAQGVAHALMGMSTSLNVDPDVESPAAIPDLAEGDDVVGAIELSSDGYVLPDDMKAGWYHVTNEDADLHELSLLRLERATGGEETKGLVDDLALNKSPRVAVEAVGGMGAISAGFDGYLYLDLPKGEYLAVDFMPDPGNPRPHMADGYYKQFTV